MQTLLKQAFPAVEPEPRHDLWPAVLRRLDKHSLAPAWYEWVMLALVALVLLAIPQAIPVLLYHL